MTGRRGRKKGHTCYPRLPLVERECRTASGGWGEGGGWVQGHTDGRGYLRDIEEFPLTSCQTKLGHLSVLFIANLPSHQSTEIFAATFLTVPPLGPTSRERQVDRLICRVITS